MEPLEKFNSSNSLVTLPFLKGVLLLPFLRGDVERKRNREVFYKAKVFGLSLLLLNKLLENPPVYFVDIPLYERGYFLNLPQGEAISYSPAGAGVSLALTAATAEESAETSVSSSGLACFIFFQSS